MRAYFGQPPHGWWREAEVGWLDPRHFTIFYSVFQIVLRRKVIERPATPKQSASPDTVACGPPHPSRSVHERPRRVYLTSKYLILTHDDFILLPEHCILISEDLMLMREIWFSYSQTRLEYPEVLCSCPKTWLHSREPIRWWPNSLFYLRIVDCDVWSYNPSFAGSLVWSLYGSLIDRSANHSIDRSIDG